MNRCINGKIVEITPEEIAQQQAQAEQAEREKWLITPYDEAVNNMIRERYPQRAVEAIINNYLAFPENNEYVREFLELQEYRVECKAFVKAKKGDTAHGDTEN